MKLRLPNKLIAAIVAAAGFCGNAHASASFVDTTTTLSEGGVSTTYAGYIITYNNTTPFHNAAGTIYAADDKNRATAGTTISASKAGGPGNQIFWRYFANGESISTNAGNTLRFDGATSDLLLDTQFTDVSLGGVIATAGDYTYTIGRASGTSNIVLEAASGTAVNMNLASNVTFKPSGSTTIKGSGTWNIATGKTLTFTNTTTVEAEQNVTITGGGGVAFMGALQGDGKMSVSKGASMTLNNVTSALSQSRIYGAGSLTVNINSGYTGNGSTVDLSNFEGDIYFKRVGTNQTRIKLSDDATATAGESFFHSNATLHMGAGTDLVFSAAAEKNLTASVAFEDSSTIFVNSSKNGQISGAVSVLSGKILTKNGSGDLKLTGDLSGFKGAVNVNGGSLLIDHTELTLNEGATVSSTLSAAGGTLNIKGNVNTSLSGTLNMTTTGSSITVSSGTQKFNTVDLSKANAAGGTMTLKSDAQVITNNLWLNKASEILLEKGAEIRTDNVSIVGMSKQSSMNNDITDTSNAADKYTSEKATFIISDVTVTKVGGIAKTLKNKLANSAVANQTDTTLTVNNSANTLVGVNAEGGSIVVENAANSAGTLASIKANGGDVTMKGLGNAVTANLNELFIADNRTVSMYQDGTSNQNAEATINVSGTGTLTARSGANLNANLTFSQGAKVDITGENGLHMGSTVTFTKDNRLLLTGSAADTLASFTLAGQSLTLFSGVDTFIAGTTSYTAETVKLNVSDYFNLTDMKYDSVREHLVLKYEGNAASDGGTISLWMQTPEPATATLSLLALAALAARRKRK